MSKEKGKLITISELWSFSDPDGKIYELARKGASIEEILKIQKPIKHKKIRGNVFLTEGVNFIWNAITGATGLTYFNSANSYIGVGDGTASESASQTGLQGTNKYYKLVDSGYPSISGNSITFRATFGGTEANFSWNEWTVANGNSDTAVNLNRKQEALGTKAPGSTWILQVTLQIT